MKSISRFSLRVMVICAAMLAATASYAMVREVSFEELTQLSDTTMEVVVINSYAQWNAEHTAIFTHYVVEPIRQAGGRSRGDQFELLFAGGRTSDGKQMIVTEVPRLEIDGQYILFLHPRETRHASPTVGMSRGAFRVVHDPETKRSVVVDYAGHVIEKDADGGLHRGRLVKVDSRGFMSDARVEAEPGMETDPVLRDPEGKIIPLQRAPRVDVQTAPESREAISSEAFMNIIERMRERQPRMQQTE